MKELKMRMSPQDRKLNTIMSKAILKQTSVSSSEWVELLTKFPAFGVLAKFNKFSAKEWKQILVSSPGLVIHYDPSTTSVLSNSDWVGLVKKVPNLKNHLPKGIVLETTNECSIVKLLDSSMEN